ncbi:threonine synthase [Marinivivus vitaminiproducens]|nr:threonine synthase [Geminicoccaceae bacterium SCSIO 64248]
MRYISTRGGVPQADFRTVLFAGLAPDGGLFVPDSWPSFTPDELRSLRGLSYPETVLAVMRPFVGDAMTEAELEGVIARAYAPFRHAATAPLRQLGPDLWLLELFHGPTFAFKDFAMQLLGGLFEHFLARSGETITIVGATSGDTGAAALAAFAGKRGVRIAILHPHGRVSDIQRRQMTTLMDANVLNLALEGTFDDCQAIVKAMLGDRALADELHLAAVNSINWVRIVAQTAYYIHAALRLGGPDRAPVFVVPTGNFGNVYAGWVATRMGLPIERLVVASNTNDILPVFFREGRYARSGVTPTLSPSMDIQVASNFERLLFELCDRDGDRLRELMAGFADEGTLSVGHNRLARAREGFGAAAVSEAETLAEIEDTLARTGEIVCPHTAVGLHVARRTQAPAGAPVIALATAHPAKFGDAVERAIGRAPVLPPALAGLVEGEERYDILGVDAAQVVERVRALAGG